MKLNCVILNYNDGDTVSKLTEMIGGYEILEQIVVVDNASTDDSPEKLWKLQDEKIRVIRAEKNGGYGAGNNLGVKYAVEKNGATHVLIANPDVAFSENTLLRMLKIFEKHHDVGVVTAAMEDVRYETMCNGWPLRSFAGELLSMGPVSRRLLGRFLEYPGSRFQGRKAAYVDVVHGSMLMVAADKFLECGGYDEGIFLYQEEAVLGRRMKNCGFRTVLLLNCSYRHEHSVSISKTFESQMARQRLREKSTLYYMQNYLSVNPLQEQIAKLWFWGIRMELKVAGMLKLI